MMDINDREIDDESFPFAEIFRPPLSDRDRDQFLEMIENPPPANDVLIAAAERHRARLRRRSQEE